MTSTRVGACDVSATYNNCNTFHACCVSGRLLSIRFKCVPIARTASPLWPAKERITYERSSLIALIYFIQECDCTL